MEESLSETTSKNARNPKCARCRNHGLLEPLKGHKKICAWKECGCSQCRLVERRREIMAQQVFVRRHQAQKEAQARKTPLLTESLASSEDGPGQEPTSSRRWKSFTVSEMLKPDAEPAVGGSSAAAFDCTENAHASLGSKKFAPEDPSHRTRHDESLSSSRRSKLLTSPLHKRLTHANSNPPQPEPMCWTPNDGSLRIEPWTFRLPFH